MVECPNFRQGHLIWSSEGVQDILITVTRSFAHGGVDSFRFREASISRIPSCRTDFRQTDGGRSSDDGAEAKRSHKGTDAATIDGGPPLKKRKEAVRSHKAAACAPGEAEAATRSRKIASGQTASSRTCRNPASRPRRLR